MFTTLIASISKASEVPHDRRTPAGPANNRRRVTVALAAALVLTLPGCATLTSVAASKIMTAAGLVSLAATGKGLADHALDMVTREDCRILDGLLRDDRQICEPMGSLATLSDFKGFIPLDDDGDNTILADTTRLGGNDALALELSNMTGRSAGDQIVVTVADTGEPATLELETSLGRDTRDWGTSQRLASVNVLMTVLR